MRRAPILTKVPPCSLLSLDGLKLKTKVGFGVLGSPKLGGDQLSLPGPVVVTVAPRNEKCPPEQGQRRQTDQDVSNFRTTGRHLHVSKLWAQWKNTRPAGSPGYLCEITHEVVKGGAFACWSSLRISGRLGGSQEVAPGGAPRGLLGAPTRARPP